MPAGSDGQPRRVPGQLVAAYEKRAAQRAAAGQRILQSQSPFTSGDEADMPRGSLRGIPPSDPVTQGATRATKIQEPKLSENLSEILPVKTSGAQVPAPPLEKPEGDALIGRNELAQKVANKLGGVKDKKDPGNDDLLNAYLERVMTRAPANENGTGTGASSTVPSQLASPQRIQGSPEVRQAVLAGGYKVSESGLSESFISTIESDVDEKRRLDKVRAAVRTAADVSRVDVEARARAADVSKGDADVSNSTAAGQGQQHKNEKTEARRKDETMPSSAQRIAPLGAAAGWARATWQQRKVAGALTVDIDRDGSASETDSESETSGSSGGESDDANEGDLTAKAEARAELARAAAAASAAAKEAAALECAKVALAEREEIAQKLANEKEAADRAAVDAAHKHTREVAALRAKAEELIRAAEEEKQRHSSSRAAAREREARLEAENTAQAKTLAAAQRALDEEVAKFLKARAKLAGLEISSSKSSRQMVSTEEPRQSPPPPSEDASWTADELARLTWKLEQRKRQVKQLEEATRPAVSPPPAMSSDREDELVLRLHQLSDHLIQKQALVESLAGEKAMLALRLENLTSTLGDERAAATCRSGGSGSHYHLASGQLATSAGEYDDEDDPALGGGGIDFSDFGPLSRSYTMGRSRKLSMATRDFGLGPHGNALAKHLASAAWGVDAFAMGSVRSLRIYGPVARAAAAAYLLLLHLWVLFVWFIHSHPHRLPGGRLT